MRFCVFGLGNIGALTAYFLRQASPIVITRRASECSESVLTFLFPNGVETSVSVEVCGLNAELKCDVAIFASKNYELADYVERFAGFYEEAFCLQNGYGAWEVAARRAASGAAYPVPVTYGVKWESGRFVIAGKGAYYLGPFRGRCPKYFNELRGALVKGGANVEVVEDVEKYVWLKLVVNCVTNPITALLGVPNGFVLESPDLWELAVGVAREVLNVAKREGVEIDVDAIEFLRDVLLKTSSNYSSMLQDVIRGRRTEIDSMNGYIARRAIELGAFAPLNFTLYKLVKALEKAKGVQ